MGNFSVKIVEIGDILSQFLFYFQALCYSPCHGMNLFFRDF